MGSRLKANEKISYVENSQFVLDRKYTDLKLIGKGSYGVVCKARDAVKNMPVAIKKITPMAKTVVDAKHVLREVRIMRHMGRHENIITIEDIVVREANDELYIIMELFDSDLHQVIQSSQVLTEQHHRHFMHQLLCGVKYLHDNRIIHRDLKPGNLLVSRNCALRITDFGLARERPMGRVVGDDPAESIDEPMTEHVITRWYRPPELMLCPDGMYTFAVDIWSCGCIFGEMISRKAMFPGKNFIDQLSRIFDVIGSPNALEVAHIENQEALKFLDSQKKKKKVQFHKLFAGVPTPAIALIDGMLQFDPSNRRVINEILLSPYFTNVPRTSQSMIFPPTAPDFNFEFERQNLTKYQLRQLIVAEQGFLRRGQDAPTGAKDRAGGGGKGITVENTEKPVYRDKDAAVRKRVADNDLPKANYASQKSQLPAEDSSIGQRRGSKNATGLREDGSDILKPPVRSTSNSRGTERRSRHGSRVEKDEAENKRSSSGLRPRHSERSTKIASEKQPAPKAKPVAVVSGNVLEDNDAEDAEIERDYERAKSYLETHRSSGKATARASDMSVPEIPKQSIVHEAAIGRESNIADREREKKYKEYQDYQKSLLNKYQKLDKEEIDPPNRRNDVFNKRTPEGKNESTIKRGGLCDEDFEVDFASESVLSTGVTSQPLYGRPQASLGRHVKKDEGKYSDDSDDDSIGMGPSKKVPAPVPYPVAPSTTVNARQSSAPPPSPSRLHKHAMTVLEDEGTSSRAMACIVSPAAPGSPSKSTVSQHPQVHRKPHIPAHAMSGFGETTGAKGTHQPAHAMPSFGETTGAKGPKQPVQTMSGFGETSGARGHHQPVAVSHVAKVAPPLPEHIPVRSPTRKHDMDRGHTADIPNVDAQLRNGIASRIHSQPLDEDISVIHEASEISVLDDERPPIARRMYNEPSNHTSDRHHRHAHEKNSTDQPPPIPTAVEKNVEAIELEKLEARLKAKRLTVPKSPKFSKMSYQRRSSGEHNQPNNSRASDANRSTSAPRRNTMNSETSKARLANIARRNRPNDGSDESDASEERNYKAGTQRTNNCSQNIPNYMKPRSQSSGRFRR